MRKPRSRGPGRRPGPLTGTRQWAQGFLHPVAEGDGLVPEAARVTVGQALRRVRPLLRPHRAGVIALLVVVAALPAVEAVEIWLFQRVVDDVLVPTSLEPLAGLAVLYVLLSLTSGLLGWVNEYVSTWVGANLSLTVRRQMLARIHQAPTDVVDRVRAGDLLTRLTADARSVESLLLAGVVDGIGTITRLVLFTGALLMLDWQLALVSFLVAPAFWWTSRRFGRRLKEVSRERRRRAGSMASVAEQSVAALALVQVHGRADAEQERFDREGRAITVAELGAARIRALYPLVIDLLELLGMLAVLTLGTWALAGGRLTLGELLVFLTFLSQLYRPIRDLGALGVELVTATAGVERVLEVLDLPEGMTERADPVIPERIEGHIAIQGVSYTYPSGPAPVVTGVDFEVRPGALVALAGPSGAGKSTLVRLVGRLADPDQGHVLLDGTDLRDLPLRLVRDQVAILLQEAPMLDANVRDNVTFARPDADDARVWAALTAAGAAGFVSALPDGLETSVGRAGRALSGGERQRIALARALVLDARVLVLDEPTTGLDADAARRLVATLAELAQDRAVLVATHDPIVLAAVDRVVTVARSAALEPAR